MKSHPDPDPNEALLEAILRDEQWCLSDADRKTQALKVFQGRHRARRLARWGGGMAGLAVVCLFLAFWRREAGDLNGRQAAERAFAVGVAPEKQGDLSDSELLALFPEGSCFLAEVDGKKKLIFYDPAIERQYVSSGTTETAARR